MTPHAYIHVNEHHGSEQSEYIGSKSGFRTSNSPEPHNTLTYLIIMQQEVLLMKKKYVSAAV